MSIVSIRMRVHVDAELAKATAAEARSDVHTAFRHLERAHVLGQRSTLAHVRVHWRMYRFAVRNGLAGEAIGQLWRVIAAAIATPFGIVPAGNTGGANVSGFRPMPVPPDLQALIDAASARAATQSVPSSWRVK